MRNTLPILSIAVMALIMLVVPAVSAAESSLDLSIKTKSVEGRSLLGLLSYKAVGQGQVISTYEPMFGGKASSRLALPEGDYQFSVLASQNLSSIPEYYGEAEVSLVRNATVSLSLEPIGFLQGEVVDKEENLVENASLAFDCINPSVIHQFPISTDSFGAIKPTAVHAGQCRVSAGFGSSVGSAEVMVMQGQVRNVTITLSKRKTEPVARPEGSSSWFPIAVAIGALIVVSAVVLFWRRAHTVIPKTHPGRHPRAKARIVNSDVSASRDAGVSIHIPGKMLAIPAPSDAVMKTLQPMERRVMECIIAEGGKTTQAKVFHETRIAKSNLFRVVQSLERKDLIKTERFGKIKRIELTGFFLGK